MDYNSSNKPVATQLNQVDHTNDNQNFMTSPNEIHRTKRVPAAETIEISHNLDDYEVLEDIGRGQFGIVQKIKLKNKIFVWKRIKYSQMQDREKQQLTQEVQLLQTLSHPNVVRYVGKINEKSKAVLYLIMEFCDGGDLGHYLDHTVKKGHYLSEDLILTWFRQLIDALHYCQHRIHGGKVLHRDLKPQNILLSGKFKKLKIADFGLAKMMQPTQLMAQTHVGTPYYMSPEVLHRQQYDEKSDIWSLGCLLFEMATGLSPFSRATSYDDLCHLVQAGEFKESEIPKIYSKEFLYTVRSMLSNDPSKRPTTDDLRQTTLYRWAASLKYKELAEHFHSVIDEQREVISEQQREILLLRSRLEYLGRDLDFLGEYIQFQRESDDAIRRSLRVVWSALKLPTTTTTTITTTKQQQPPHTSVVASTNSSSSIPRSYPSKSLNIFDNVAKSENAFPDLDYIEDRENRDYAEESRLTTPDEKGSTTSAVNPNSREFKILCSGPEKSLVKENERNGKSGRRNRKSFVELQ